MCAYKVALAKSNSMTVSPLAASTTVALAIGSGDQVMR
jgi:hypothetical protein